MKLIYDGDDNGLRQAVDFVVGLTNDEDFWGRIADHGNFSDTDKPSATIAATLRACDDEVRVVHWRPLARPSTIAVTDPGRRFEILYNMRNFAQNSTAAKVHTMMHEFVHNVDLFADGNRAAEYTHESRPYSESAPYWIGDLAQSFYQASVSSTLMKSFIKQEFAGEKGYDDDLIGVEDGEIES